MVIFKKSLILFCPLQTILINITQSSFTSNKELTNNNSTFIIILNFFYLFMGGGAHPPLPLSPLNPLSNLQSHLKSIYGKEYR